jgi:hypothetical protein
MENPVEHVLKDKGPRGLSLRQLSLLTGVDTRRIKYHIYNSMHIEDTDPFVHGSLKNKIRVFSYTPESQKYHSRKLKKKIQTDLLQVSL